MTGEIKRREAEEDVARPFREGCYLNSTRGLDPPHGARWKNPGRSEDNTNIINGICYTGTKSHGARMYACTEQPSCARKGKGGKTPK